MIVNIDKDNKLAEPLEAFKRYQLKFPGKDGNIDSKKSWHTVSEEEVVEGDAKDKQQGLVNRSEDDSSFMSNLE